MALPTRFRFSGAQDTWASTRLFWFGLLMCCAAAHVASAQVAPCGSGTQFTSLYPGQTVYNSGSYLSASGGVNVNTNGSGVPSGNLLVTFQAITQICLGPGFQAAANGTGTGFQAFIATPVSSVTISAPTQPTWIVGGSQSMTLTASGGTAPYTWTLSSGSLPTGLSLNSTNSGAYETISGSPTMAGAYPLSLSVVDSSSPAQSAQTTLTLTTQLPFTLNPSTIPNVSPSGGTSVTSISVTPLQGVSWTSTSSATGWLTVSGSGSAAGTVIVGASQNTGAAARTANVNIAAGSYTASLPVTQVAPLTIPAQFPSNAYLNNSYSWSTTASGGSPPYIWTITSLPAGLTSSSNGLISGTPTTAGNPTVSLSVHDSNNPALTATGSISISVMSPFSNINPSSLPNMPAAGLTRATNYLANQVVLD